MSAELSFDVPKQAGAHGDVLLAVGLADLLASAAGAAAVRLHEEAASFHVEPERPVDLLEELAVAPGYPYLLVKAGGAPNGLPPGSVVSYPEERKRFDLFTAALKAIREKKVSAIDPEISQQLEVNRPRPDWRLLQVLNVLQGFNNTNRVHAVISTEDPETLRAQIVAGLDKLRSGERSGLSWGVSAVQLFNPNAAKGYGALKPRGTDRNDRTKEQWTDPLLEWLRYRGYFACACPYFTGNKGEHIRILCPVPANISLAGLREVAELLRRAPIYGSAPKLDALAVIHLARILIERSEFGDQPPDIIAELGIRLSGGAPARVISGLAITHYQSLGQARAVSQLAQLALPDWFPIAGPADARAWLAILDEHRRVVGALRDDRSDEIGLLIAYRRFLEQRGEKAAEALLDFMGAYGSFVVPARDRDRGRRLPRFTTTHAQRVLGGLMPDYAAILESPGFQAVAAAIRRSTVSAQAQKAMGRPDYREIRYDLLPEIRRKRALPKPDALIETLSDFVASYNYENARRREMQKQAPANVTTQQFEELVTLIEEHGAPLVGALLAAYGSCREPREPELPGDEEADEEALEPSIDVQEEAED